MSMGYLGTSWDGVSQGYNIIDSSDCSALSWDSSKLVYDGSGVVWDKIYDSLPRYTIPGGIICNDKIGVCLENYVGIEDSTDTTDTPTEPSDLKNTKSNIRKIKPDINSELKRV